MDKPDILNDPTHVVGPESNNQRSGSSLADTCPSTGTVMARLSLRSKLVGDWKTMFYVFHTDTILRFYRHPDDFYHFPVGTQIKREIHLSATMECSRLQSKYYSRLAQTLYYFTLYNLESQGKRFVLKVGHADKTPILSLLSRLRQQLLHTQSSTASGYVHLMPSTVRRKRR